jgi:hypothetical protein
MSEMPVPFPEWSKMNMISPNPEIPRRAMTIINKTLKFLQLLVAYFSRFKSQASHYSFSAPLNASHRIDS